MESDLRVEQQVKLTWWPSPQDYNEAVQTPGISYEDPELQRGDAELNNLGIPKANTGNFASVYHVSVGKQEWAVRCFLRNVQGQKERYKHIEAAINESNAKFLARFHYVEQGIRVHANWFPILKMEWVNGVSFTEHLQANLAHPDVLRKTAADFKSMVLQMQACGIAHGDLQHGNIIVTSEGIKLVDYDGMFVPKLAGEVASELGHRNYQHPKRQPNHFDQSIDNFSAWLIYSSIICLSEDASLFYKLGVGDECLLFKELDLKRPSISRTFDILENHPNAAIQKHARWMRNLLRRQINQIPSLNEEIDETVVASPPEKPAVTKTTTRGAWLGAISFALLIGLLAWWNISISQNETQALDAATLAASGATLDETAKNKINEAAHLFGTAKGMEDVVASNKTLMKAIENYSIYPESQHAKLVECLHMAGHNFEKMGAYSEAVNAYERARWYLRKYGSDSNYLDGQLSRHISDAKSFSDRQRQTSGTMPEIRPRHSTWFDDESHWGKP
jgi:predicted Ser/Thr protein kinase